MGLGLSALVAALLLLPGVFFLLGLNRQFDASTPSSSLGETFGVSLFVVVAASVLAHHLGLAGVAVAHRFGLAPAADLDAVFVLLAAVDDPNLILAAIKSATTNTKHVVNYFAITVGLSLFAGWLARNFLEPPGWYALLTPPKKNGPSLATLTAEICLADKAYLYSGILYDYEIDRSGSLARVTLKYAQRRQLDNGSPAPAWTPIPGDYFVMLMDGVRTVNIDYWYLEDTLTDLQQLTDKADDISAPQSPEPNRPDHKAP